MLNETILMSTYKNDIISGFTQISLLNRNSFRKKNKRSDNENWCPVYRVPGMTCKHPFFTSESSTASQAVTTVPSIPQYLLKSNHMLASNTSTPIQCFKIYLYFKYIVIFKHFIIMFCIYDVLFSSNMIKLKIQQLEIYWNH